MRVLHCIWRLGLGGSERQLVQLSAALRARHVDVHVLTVFPGRLDDQMAATGAAMHRLRPLGKYDLTLFPRAVRFIRGLRPDVVTTWLTQMDIVGGVAATIGAVPWIVCERSAAGSYPPALVNAARAKIGARATHIIANSEGGRDYWLPYTDRRRISIIPNIVPVAEIERAPVKEDAEGELILYVGRFSAEKNLERLLDALSEILPRRRARAVFCGDGPLRAVMTQKAALLGIADRVSFLGAVPDVWSWMKRASVLVAVSIFEGNPNVVLEAIACGAPLVVSNIKAYGDILDDRSAVLVDPLSASSIAAGIEAVLDRPQEASARAERARRAIAGQTPEEIAARYIDVFDSVIGRRL